VELTPENEKELEKITGPGVPSTDASPPNIGVSNETAANNPDDPNSTAPLPEDPNAPTLDSLQKPGTPATPPPADIPSIAGAPPVGTPPPEQPDAGPQAPPTIPYPKNQPITFQGAANTVNNAANAGIDEANAQGKVGPANAADREAMAEGADMRSVEGRNSVAERDVLQEQANKARQEANKHYEELQKKAEDFKFHDYWADKSTGQRVLATIGMALGGFNRHWNGGRNIYQDRLNGEIEKDFENQKQELLKRKDAAKEARERGLDLTNWYKEQLAELTVKEGMAYKAAGDEGEAHVLRNGGNAEDAKNDVTVQGLRAKSEEVRAKGYVDLEKAKLEAEAQKAKAAAQGGGSLNVTAVVDDLRRQGMTPGQILRDPRLVSSSPKEVLLAIKASDGAQSSEGKVAGDVDKEMAARLKEINDPKNGLGTKYKQVTEALDAVKSNPGNPTVWTNMIDGMIRANTGRAAIMSQYKLYTGKAANSEGEAMSWLNQKLGDGTLGDDVKRNLLNAAKASQTEYQGAIGKVENNFRETFEHDKRVENNPRASASYKTNHMQFKSFPGGEGIGGTGAPATTAPATTAPVMTATGPNGQRLKLEGGKWVPM
jgi:hypothetical protein